MSTNIERAAEVIKREYGPCNDSVNHDGRQAQWASETLAYDGLLVTDEQARLIRLGQAVESYIDQLMANGAQAYSVEHYETARLYRYDAAVLAKAVYAEAEREQ